MVFFNDRRGTNWNPLRELTQLATEAERMFTGLAHETSPLQRAVAANVDADDEGVFVRVEVPGFSSDDVEVSLEGGVLAVRGKLRVKEGDADGGEAERVTSSFERSFRMPFRIDQEAVTATLEHGLLQVHLPRAQEDRARTIPIQVS